MSTPSLSETVKANATLMTLLGVGLIVLGVAALSAPFWSGVAAALLVGCLVLAAGVGQCVFAFQAQSLGRGILAFLLGGLTVLCGLVMVAHPLLNLGFLTLALAAWFLVTGVFEVLYALQLRPLRGWGWTAVGGALSAVLGAMIYSQWPLSGAWAVGVLVGVKVLFLGVTMVVLGSAARELAARAQA
jgi:uncharacterized membrane protein HdeD (DUF308 family)